jgi:hypothetical protein
MTRRLGTADPTGARGPGGGPGIESRVFVSRSRQRLREAVRAHIQNSAIAPGKSLTCINAAAPQATYKGGLADADGLALAY